MAKKTKASDKDKKDEEEVEVKKKPEKKLPPVEYKQTKVSVEHTHPACLGHVPGQNGQLLWNPAKVSAVCLGSIWERKVPALWKDSRSAHPSTFGYHEDPAPGNAIDPAAYNPAMVSPIFAGAAMTENKPARTPAELRGLLPAQSSSAEGKYLDEQVWPTLELGLEKLLNAIKYHVPKDVVGSYPGGWNGADVQRVTKPRHAVDFDPLEWLATYLAWYNPNVPSKWTPETAATKVQSAYRGYRGRVRVNRLKEVIRLARAAADLAQLQNESATKIQALYRGHSVRLNLALGHALSSYDGFTAGREVST